MIQLNIARRALVALTFGGSLLIGSGQAQSIDPLYAGSYSLLDLGTVPGLPAPAGGLTLLAGSSNTLLIGGSANTASGAIYSVGVTRDGGGHINGFSGAPTLFSTAPYIDGGLSYGPGGVLFYTGYPVNTIGQIEPGSVTPDNITLLGSLGVTGSVGSLAFVPPGHAGAGELKAVSYSTGAWYTIDYSANGSGNFDLTGATLEVTIPGGPEGIAYVPTGSPVFTVPSVLVSEYGAGTVGVYETDANGDPILGTRTTFISGLTGAEGAFIDPLTGDFLFSTFGGGNKLIRVSGFQPTQPPPTGVPDEGSTGLLVLVAAGMLAVCRKRFLQPRS